jgi:membrane protease YdiL (CAAX protease family)
MVGFSISEVKSVFMFLGLYKNTEIPEILHILAIISKITAILVTLYIVFIQGRNLKDIGLNINKRYWVKQLYKDILKAFLITFIILILETLLGFLLKFLGVEQVQAKNLGFMHLRVVALFFISMLVNAFFEEFIVRGYMMTEIELLTNNKYLAIIIATIFQTSYHLYQGLYPLIGLSIIFLVFSIYFAHSKKLMPVIISHFIFDIV